MSELYTVAYPELGDADRARIEGWRAVHDARKHALLPAHFTLLFGCSAVAESVYLAHVAEIAARMEAIEFHCRSAILAAHPEGERAHVFLVPWEGRASIKRLHDALYTGPLAPHLRRDLPYTPHLTVANLASRTEAERVRAAIDREGIDVRGRISALHVGAPHDDHFAHVGSFRLGGRGG